MLLKFEIIVLNILLLKILSLFLKEPKEYTEMDTVFLFSTAIDARKGSQLINANEDIRKDQRTVLFD